MHERIVVAAAELYNIIKVQISICIAKGLLV